MAAKIIDGVALAARLQREVAAEVAQLKTEHGVETTLAAVLVGDDPASQAYVRLKHRRCQEVGIRSVVHHLPSDAGQEEVDGLVASLSADRSVHGILVQLPLPGQLSEDRVLSAIDPKKDVDGLHPVNMGRLAMKGHQPFFLPATPAGIMRLLAEEKAPIEGVKAVVVGRSKIVGLPVALLLLRANASVTLCHSRTRELPAVTRQADILVVAVGQREMVRGDGVKPGAIVVDVGINRVDDPSAPGGYRLVGDVAFDEVKEVASMITPVPGGVGPMTIAMLLKNTVRAARLSLEKE